MLGQNYPFMLITKKEALIHLSCTSTTSAATALCSNARSLISALEDLKKEEENRTTATADRG